MDSSNKILEYSCKEETEAIYLSKFKLWICKIFKIVPEKKYYYIFEIKVPYGNYVEYDLLLLENGENFVITGISCSGMDEYTLIIQNLNFCDKIRDPGRKFVIFSNAFNKET